MNKLLDVDSRGSLIVTFPFDRTIVNNLKDYFPLGYLNWDRINKAWVLSPQVSIIAERWAVANGFTITEAAEQKLKEIARDPMVIQVQGDHRVPSVVDHDGIQFQITFGYKTDIVSAVKAIPGKQWHPDQQIWTAPNSSTYDVKMFANLYNFEVTEAAQKFIDDTLEGQVQEVSDETLKGTLYRFQEAGEEFIRMRKRVLLGDEMGTGKTVQTIAASVRSGVKCTLILCPKKLIYNWKSEWETWTNKVVHIVGTNSYGDSLYKSGSTLNLADVYIANYEKASILEKHAKHFQFVAFDEAHYLKNANAKRTKAAMKVGAIAPYRVAITGTPVVNNLTELHTIIKLIGQSENFPNFENYYMVRGKARLRRVKELNQHLLRTCYIRREKKDVLKDLPEKIRQQIYVPMSDEVRKLYDTALHDLSTYLAKHKGRSEEQISNAMKNETLVKVNYLKQIAVRGKIEAAADIVEGTIEEGEKVVIFAHHKETVDHLMERFKMHNPVRITGSEDDVQTHSAVQQFQNNDTVKLVICSLKAASVGLTLTAARTVYFFELGWTPAEMTQAEDRCHRKGAKDTVYAKYLLAENSIDNHIYGIIERKRALSDIVTGNKTKIQTEIIKDLLETISYE